MKARFVVSMVVLLFAASCATTTQTYDDESFFDAIAGGTPEEVHEAIRSGANANAMDEDGFTPLMLAAGFNEDSGVTEVLLSAGADVNVRSPLEYEWFPGFTPLMRALGFNHNPEVAAMLIEAGTDVNIGHDVGFTALMIAAINQAPPHHCATPR